MRKIRSSLYEYKKNKAGRKPKVFDEEALAFAMMIPGATEEWVAQKMGCSVRTLYAYFRKTYNSTFREMALKQQESLKFALKTSAVQKALSMDPRYNSILIKLLENVCDMRSGTDSLNADSKDEKLIINFSSQAGGVIGNTAHNGNSGNVVAEGVPVTGDQLHQGSSESSGAESGQPSL